MPVNLSDYTPAMRKFIRDRDMAALYVATYAGQAQPCRIAHAIDLFGHLRTMAATTTLAIDVHHLMWMPSAMTAKVIEAHVREMLKAKLLRQKWFNCPAGEAVDLINTIVDRFNFGRVFSHRELMDHGGWLRQEPQRGRVPMVVIALRTICVLAVFAVLFFLVIKMAA